MKKHFYDKPRLFQIIHVQYNTILCINQ